MISVYLGQSATDMHTLQWATHSGFLFSVEILTRDSCRPSLMTDTLSWGHATDWIRICCLHLSPLELCHQFAFSCLEGFQEPSFLLSCRVKNAGVVQDVQEMHYKQQLIFNRSSVEFAVQYFMTWNSSISRNCSRFAVTYVTPVCFVW